MYTNDSWDAFLKSLPSDYSEPKYIDIAPLLEEAKVYTPNRILTKLENKTFSSKKEFYEQLQHELMNHTSYYLFPGEICFFYPRVRKRKSTKRRLCHLTGVPIQIGDTYYEYRPLLENVNRKKTYTIHRSIISSSSYIDTFPQTLHEFEEWSRKIDCVENLMEDEIDFYSFKSNAGDTALHLSHLDKTSQKAKERKRKREFVYLEKLERELLIKMESSLEPEKIKKKLHSIEKRRRQLGF